MKSGKSKLYDVAREVTQTGPDDVAFDGLRLLQHPERFRKILLGQELDIVPVTVQLWPSLSCDVRCPTCPYRLTDARKIADEDKDLHLMPMDLFRRLVRSMATAGVESVFLTGGGEPILHPELPEMAELIRSEGMAWGLFTNGIKLTADLADRLFQAEPGFFRVSLDAGNADLYRKIYAAEPEVFELVKANTVAAGRIAAKRGVRWFGVGFAVMPNTSLKDIVDIRETFSELVENSDFGVNLASFRPRVIHHSKNKVVVPQRHNGMYHELAEIIREEIEYPLLEKYGDKVRIDHKFGNFSDCDRNEVAKGGWGGSWLATLDHLARGSIVSHLTGASNNPSAWGSALEGGGFGYAWNSKQRREAQRRVIDGQVKLPIANGFRSVDAFIEKVKRRFPEPLCEEAVVELMEGIEDWDFYRSQRPEFVG